AGVGLLLRAVRPAAEHVRRVAAGVRPDRPGLLPACLRRAGHVAVDPDPAAVLVHADRVQPGDVPPEHPAAAAPAPVEPLPADPATVPPAGQPVDAGSDPARGQPHLAERPRTGEARPDSDRPGLVAGRAGADGGGDVGAVEPRAVRRPERAAPGRA